MKKGLSILSVLVTIALILTAFTACGKKPAEEPTDNNTDNNEVENVSGGWTANSTFEKISIPEDAQKALALATEELTGATYEAVAYLGSQVVAGTNYALLCNITPVVPDAKGTLNVVTIYKDLDGKASIKDTKEIDITKYTTENEINFEELSGGWNNNEAIGSDLTGDTKLAFDKAFEDFAGVDYSPLALLGTQVVAGTNFAVLCKASTVTAEPQTALAVVIIYADLQGNASITSICQFNIAE